MSEVNYIKTRLRNAAYTSAEWLDKDPILNKGELGLEVNTNKIKIGNGALRWSQLAYVSDLEDYYNKAETEQTVNTIITDRSQSKVQSLGGINLGSLVLDGDEEVSVPLVDAVILETSARIRNGGDVEVTVTYKGDAQKLKLHHSYDKYHMPTVSARLPWFNIYPDNSNVWGNPESTQQAVTAGMVAEYYDQGVKSFVILISYNGQTYEHIKNNGYEMEFYPELINHDGAVAGTATVSTGFPG